MADEAAAAGKGVAPAIAVLFAFFVVLLVNWPYLLLFMMLLFR